MEQHARLVLDALSHLGAVLPLRREPQDRWKWIAAITASGPQAAAIGSAHPRNHPSQTRALVAKKVVLERTRHPSADRRAIQFRSRHCLPMCPV
jgi:hypothetical protein